MNRNFALAAAAALAAALSAPGMNAQAAVSATELSQINRAIVASDVQALLRLIRANPAILALPGALGEALRAFSENPQMGTLAAVNAALADRTVSDYVQRGGVIY